MSDKGIIFSAPMVRALLAGSKTQTRRLLKLPTKTHSGGPIYERPDMGGWAATTHGGEGCFTIGRDGQRHAVPEIPGLWHQTTGTCVAAPYVVGARLYVRETWSHTGDHVFEVFEARIRGIGGVIYRADESSDWPHAKYWPSIHMPREFSRITLTVADVRVQRLQDTSEADARAEGVEMVAGRNYRDGYAILWNSLHTKPSERWDDNPWIVAVTFDVDLRNIDAVRS